MNNKNISFAVLLLVAAATVPAFAGPFPVIPSGTVPAACATMKLHKQYMPLLDCYLSHPDNFQIAVNIRRQYGTQTLTWSQWPAIFKQELAMTFDATMRWWEQGMASYPGTQAPEVPANIAEAVVYHGTVPPWTVLSETDIARIYNAKIAMVLASEIYSWVPWSVRGYVSPGIPPAVFAWLFLDYVVARGYTDSTGSYVSLGRGPLYNTTPGNPLTVLKFLKANNLIAVTREATIERILNWARLNLTHMHGDFTAVNYYHHWQYWGAPPVARILAGTVTTYPGLTNESYSPHRWTAGCHGTSALLIELFRAVNIPVYFAPVGEHASVSFPSEQKYMTHGDDPYSPFAMSNRPVSAFLIDSAKYSQWFTSNSPQAANLNVGRGVLQDNINYPSNALVDLHKLDFQEGRTHAASRVYDLYKNWYTVTALEQTGLWQRLDAKL